MLISRIDNVSNWSNELSSEDEIGSSEQFKLKKVRKENKKLKSQLEQITFML